MAHITGVELANPVGQQQCHISYFPVLVYTVIEAAGGEPWSRRWGEKSMAALPVPWASQLTLRILF